MTFLDFADHMIEQGIGRRVSRQEALEPLSANLREGLVLMPSNPKEAQFVCSGCPDCCGMLAGLRRSERPADRAGSSYRAVVDVEACIACGSCARVCPMEAIGMDAGYSAVDAVRCIGWGVCVVSASRERSRSNGRPPRSSRRTLWTSGTRFAIRCGSEVRLDGGPRCVIP